MTEKPNRPLKSLPVANYRSALARAVEWLGDRYAREAHQICAGSPVARNPAALRLLIASTRRQWILQFLQQFRQMSEFFALNHAQHSPSNGCHFIL